MARGSTEAAVAWHVLSQTAEYALRAVLYIGGHEERTAVPVADVAGALGVPEKYLGRVLNTLRRAGTLQSKRGAQGGFWLTRPAGSVTLFEVVAPFGPIGEARPCLLRRRQCGTHGQCSAHDVWRRMAAGVRDFFEQTTVADLLPVGPPIMDEERRRQGGSDPFSGAGDEVELAAGESAVFAPGELHAIEALSGPLRFRPLIAPRPAG